MNTNEQELLDLLNQVRNGVFTPLRTWRRNFSCQGVPISITISPDGCALIAVNNRYYKTPHEGSNVIIWRRILKEWEKLLLEVPPDLEIYASPMDDSPWRDKMMRKLGFVYADNDNMILKR